MVRLDAGHVFSGARIYTNSIPFIHEHGDHEFVTGFDGCGFGGVGGGVACNGGFANGDEEFDEVFRFDGERFAFEEFHLDGAVLFDELECVCDLVVVEGDLLVSFFVHEVIEFAVRVEVFHILGFDVSKFEFIGGVEGFFESSSVNDVFHFGTNECRAFAGFDVLELNDSHNVAFIQKGNALSDVACHDLCHNFYLLLSCIIWLW